MGSTVGPFVWNLMNFTLFFYAIFSVPRITEVQKCKTYLYTALILATTQMSIQFNPVVAYLFLFAFSLLERGKPYPAILLILVSGFCKIYGIFELALLLCYPKFWRNLGFTIVLAAVLLVLPAVNLGFGGLIPHYERWAEVLSGHVDQFQFYAVFNLYPIHDLLTPVMTQVQIGSILALAVLFVLNYRKFGRFDFRLGSLRHPDGLGYPVQPIDREAHLRDRAGRLSDVVLGTSPQRLARPDAVLGQPRAAGARPGRSDLPVARHALSVRHRTAEHLLLYVYLAENDLRDFPATDRRARLPRRTWPTGRPTERFAAEISPLQEFIVNCVGSPA